MMESIKEESPFLEENPSNSNFIQELLSEIIENSLDSSHKTDFHRKYELMALQNKYETVKHKFLILESQLDICKPPIENLSNLQNNLHSIYSILFEDNHENYKNLTDFLDVLKSAEKKQEKTNPNLITIDLNESIKTRNQKKSTSSLKENNKIPNMMVENFETYEKKESKNKRKGKEDDEEYEPFKETVDEEYSDFENKFTNRKRKAKHDLKRTTTAKKSKKELLKEKREMKEFSILAQNSIEYDVFF